VNTFFHGVFYERYVPVRASLVGHLLDWIRSRDCNGWKKRFTHGQIIKRSWVR